MVGSLMIEWPFSLRIAATVCVQQSPDVDPIWLRGPCTISRSPVAHPGDSEFASSSCAIRSDKNDQFNE
jgi:hypothetical protein